MKTKTKIILITLSVVVVGVTVLITVIMPLHPLFRSLERLSKDTLRLTPMGMHINDVAALVKRQMVIKNVTEWRHPIINNERGYVNPTTGEVAGWSSTPTSGSSAIVGHKSVTVIYGKKLTSIEIYWGFDENGILVDVLVQKWFDKINLGGLRKTAN